MDKIIVKGARENNLKNVNVSFPKDCLVVATGLSGSGKTSFAFDTIYKEGQRRYLESLSSYARQFIGDMGKPDCDSVEGLSPAVSIDQKSGSKNPRSTVGTVTEINDYLRLLYARVGIPYCPNHHIPITPMSIDEMIEDALKYDGEKAIVLSPVVRGEKGTFENLLEHLRHAGYTRVVVDGVMQSLEDNILLKKTIKHEILLVIDRLLIDKEDRLRLSDAFELALKESDGLVLLRLPNKDKTYSAKHSCPICGFSIPDLEPKLFSFNAPMGACDLCDGLGFKRHIDVDKLIPFQDLSIRGGALSKWSGEDNRGMVALLSFMKKYNISPDKPFKELTEDEKKLILYGSDESYNYTYTSKSSSTVYNVESTFEGVVRNLERRYTETSSRFIREWLEQYMVDDECPKCHGKRLNEAALSVYVDKYNIDDLSRL
ncbi:MAG: excinuclease ABC subunit UvrA, partial [Gammaproteobacteria bacterium]|nr:excinuclease ABC subunit UvrA [Gammaproteobacteria bacterium]